MLLAIAGDERRHLKGSDNKHKKNARSHRGGNQQHATLQGYVLAMGTLTMAGSIIANIEHALSDVSNQTGIIIATPATWLAGKKQITQKLLISSS